MDCINCLYVSIVIALRLFKTVNNRKNILAIGNLYKNHLLTKMYIFVYYIKKDKTPSSSRTLKVSYIGMKSQEVPASASTISVKLKDDSVELGEVIVSGAVGIKKKKSAVTSSYSTVNNDELKAASNPDAVRSLVGKVSGLTINNTTNGVGGTTSIRIRSMLSFIRASVFGFAFL